MDQSMDVASHSTTREEHSDEVSNSSTTIEDPIIPKESLFQQYGHWVKDKVKQIFKICRSYEQPYKNYYIVITPYGRKKGMQLDAIIKMIRRWGCTRVIITKEVRSKETKRKINPHFNIIITTKKDIGSSNSNNLNIKSQILPNIGDVARAIDYSFKEYVQPIRFCLKGKDYYVWQKNNLINSYKCPDNIEETTDEGNHVEDM
nr:Rep [Kummerowia striata CRESS virus]